MPSLLDQFNALTSDDFEAFVRDRTQETLHLEFKQVSDISLSSTNAKKTLAKLVSAFANSDGGLIVWGIEARRQDGVDAAVAVKHFDGYESYVSRLQSLTGSAVLPIVEDVLHKPVSIPESDQGYAITYVPVSDSGPHMAKFGEDRYYKRSGDSNYRMEHFDIADMFGRRKAPKLRLEAVVPSIARHPSSSARHVTVQLYIVNDGRGSAKSPFLELHRSDGLTRAPEYHSGRSLTGLHPYEGGSSHTRRKYGRFGDVVIHPGTRILGATLIAPESLRDGYSFDYILASEDMAPKTGTFTVPPGQLAKFIK